MIFFLKLYVIKLLESETKLSEGRFASFRQFGTDMNKFETLAAGGLETLFSFTTAQYGKSLPFEAIIGLF